MDEKTIARFWAKVEKSGPVPCHVPELGACWVWTGALDPQGYGRFRPVRRAHRASWIIATGEDPGKLCVLHRCDNPRCVRPEHLFLGTRTDNARDRESKRRSLVGEALPHAKLTPEIVRAMRARYVKTLSGFGYGSKGAVQPDGLSAIAAAFGVSRATVHLAVTRRTWRHVE